MSGLGTVRATLAPNRDTADYFSPGAGQQQTAAWWAVHAGQIGDLLGKILKAEINIQFRGVMLNQRFRHCEIFSACCLLDFNLTHGRTH